MTEQETIYLRVNANESTIRALQEEITRLSGENARLLFRAWLLNPSGEIQFPTYAAESVS